MVYGYDLTLGLELGKPGGCNSPYPIYYILLLYTLYNK